MVKISVIIICFNQESTIQRALDSVIDQRKYIHEIIVSDDCSVDSTWDLIQSFKEKHPTIIKPFRNKTNLGISKNIESTWSRISGDMVITLAGDDEYNDQYFKKITEYISINSITVKDNHFAIYCDYIAVSPDTKRTLFRNDLVTQNDSISLKLRNLISSRAVIVSRTLFEMYHPVENDIGVNNDMLIDIQTQLYSKKNYYFSYTGAFYYTKIGVSASLSKYDMIKTKYYTRNILLNQLRNIGNNDRHWLLYEINRYKYLLEPSVSNMGEYFRYFISLKESEFGIRRYFLLFVKLINDLKHLI